MPPPYLILRKSLFQYIHQPSSPSTPNALPNALRAATPSSYDPSRHHSRPSRPFVLTLPF
ncbi:hypothetical protein FA13DRAFT_1744137 [Coprinellus micaceus]|uniref:Uncharacterized protein n=1 Tax=Coprinellus micaceus TaxID=71717 RepID=A0A4Y7SDE6_COPMI|nr:hypothetical protein FA13DRAFT_1744137 [Coprinellus micaceus]